MPILMGLRIGMVCHPSMGGSGILATELGHQLARHGNEIHFISHDRPFRLSATVPKMHFHSVPLFHYDLFHYPDYTLPLATKIAEVALSEKLQLLHVHYAIPHTASALLATQILEKEGVSLPVVTTLHGTDITLVGPHAAYRSLLPLLVAQSSAVTAVSSALRNAALAHIKDDPSIQVIPNFTEVDPRASSLGKCLRRNLFGAEANHPLLVHSSNFRPVKRTPDLIPLFARLRQSLPAKLLLIGQGAQLNLVRTLAAQHALEKDIHFLGPVRYIAPYMAMGDFFLLPSEQEAFGLAALEAMAYGLPVIGTRVGGIHELVEEGVTGLLYPVGATEQMADGILDLLKEPTRLKEMRKAAKERVTTHFAAEKVVPQYHALYASLLSKEAKAKASSSGSSCRAGGPITPI